VDVGCRLNETFSEYGELANFCEHGNELSGFISEYHQLLEEDAVLLNYS
jgi:hypothetical protein